MSEDRQQAAEREAAKQYPDPVDVETGEPVDDWGYAECERRAYVAGWLAHAERTPDVETIARKIRPYWPESGGQSDYQRALAMQRAAAEVVRDLLGGGA